MDKFFEWFNKVKNDTKKYNKVSMMGYLVQYLHLRYRQQGIKYGISFCYDMAFLSAGKIVDGLCQEIKRLDKK